MNEPMPCVSVAGNCPRHLILPKAQTPNLPEERCKASLKKARARWEERQRRQDSPRKPVKIAELLKLLKP